MPDQPSLDALEQMERHFQLLIDLLNQADQALQPTPRGQGRGGAARGPNIGELVSRPPHRARRHGPMPGAHQSR